MKLEVFLVLVVVLVVLVVVVLFFFIQGQTIVLLLLACFFLSPTTLSRCPIDLQLLDLFVLNMMKLFFWQEMCGRIVLLIALSGG